MGIRITAYTCEVGAARQIEMAQGEDREFRPTFTDNGTPVDFTGAAAIVLTIRNRATGILLLARNYSGLQGLAAAGTPRFQILQADTATQSVGPYDVDISWTDASGYQTQLQAVSTFMLVERVGEPGDAVTTPPAIPVVYGLNWFPGFWSTPTGGYKINDAVQAYDGSLGATAISTFRALLAGVTYYPIGPTQAVATGWAYVGQHGGGGTGTLATDYAQGKSQNDSTVSLDSTRLGVRIIDNATPISGPLFQVMNSAKTSSYFDVSPTLISSSYARNLGATQIVGFGLANTTAAANNAQQFSPVASFEGAGWGTSGSTSMPARIFMQAQPTQGTTPLVEHVWFQQVGNAAPVEMFRLKQDSSGVMSIVGGAASNNAKFMNNVNTGMNLGAGGFIQYLVQGTPAISLFSTSMNPSVDLSTALGLSTVRYSEVWAVEHAGREQTIPAASTLTLNPSMGQSMRLTLSSTAINAGGITANAGKPDQRISLSAIQDGSGGRTLLASHFSSSFVLQGGTYIASTGASKRDILTFKWDATDAKWYEADRSVNL